MHAILQLAEVAYSCTDSVLEHLCLRACAWMTEKLNTAFIAAVTHTMGGRPKLMHAPAGGIVHEADGSLSRQSTYNGDKNDSCFSQRGRRWG